MPATCVPSYRVYIAYPEPMSCCWT